MTAESRFLVVLTATVTPTPNIGTQIVRKDPALRRADYLRAFTHWLDHPDPRLSRILLIENSGANMDEFSRLADAYDKKVEIISVPPKPLPSGMHYGYSELAMLDDGLRRSALRPNTSHMIKATGRLVFPALPELLNRLPETIRFAADARRGLPFRRLPGGFVRTEVFVTMHDFYDSVLRTSYSALLKMETYPFLAEHIFYERLMPFKHDDDVRFRFPINCEPVGFAGHAGKKYDRPGRVLITKARALSRVIAPNLWL